MGSLTPFNPISLLALESDLMFLGRGLMATHSANEASSKAPALPAIYTCIFQEGQVAWLGRSFIRAMSIPIKRLPKNIKSDSTARKETGLSGVKLPKISVPTFDRKVVNWTSYREQFDATIQCKTELNNTKKLMYCSCKRLSRIVRLDLESKV